MTQDNSSNFWLEAAIFSVNKMAAAKSLLELLTKFHVSMSFRLAPPSSPNRGQNKKEAERALPPQEKQNVISWLAEWIRIHESSKFQLVATTRRLSQDAGRTWKRRKLFNEIFLTSKISRRSDIPWPARSVKQYAKQARQSRGCVYISPESVCRRWKGWEQESRRAGQLLHTLEIKLTFFDPVRRRRGRRLPALFRKSSQRPLFLTVPSWQRLGIYYMETSQN